MLILFMWPLLAFNDGRGSRGKLLGSSRAFYGMEARFQFKGSILTAILAGLRGLTLGPRASAPGEHAMS